MRSCLTADLGDGKSIAEFLPRPPRCRCDHLSRTFSARRNLGPLPYLYHDSPLNTAFAVLTTVMTRPCAFASPQDGAARFYKAFYRWSKHTRASIHQDRPRRYVQPATSHNHIIHRTPGDWKPESFLRCSSGTRTVRKYASSAAAEVAQPHRRTETVWVDALFDRITVHQKDGIQEESLCTIYEGGADEHPDGRTDQKPILLWGTEDSIARAKELVETALGELRVCEEVHDATGHSNLGEGQDSYQSPLHLTKHDTDALPNDMLDDSQASEQAHGISSHSSYEGRQPIPEESIVFSPFDQWHASQPSEEAQGIESTKDFVPRSARDSGRGGGNRIDSPVRSRPSGKKGNLQSRTGEASSHENTGPQYEEVTIFIPRKAWKSIRGEDDRFLDSLKEEYNIASFDIEDNDSTSRLRVRGTKRAIDSVSEIIEQKIELIAEGVQKVDADVFMRKTGAQPDRTDRFKTAMRCMPHPVTLITTSDNPGNVPAVPFSHLKKKLIQRDPTKLSQIQRLRAISDTDRGVTVNSLTAVTVDPPALTFNIKTPSRTLDAMRSNGFINVHILANNSIGAAIADAFTKPHDQPAESFLRLMATQPRVSFGRMTHGELALNGPGVIAVLRCKLLQSHSMTVGDHVVLLAEVMTVFFTTQRDAVSDPSSGDESVSLAYAHRKFRRHGGAIEFRSTDQVDKWFSKGLGVQKKPQAEEAAAVEPLVEESADPEDPYG
ncbi:hypothetical protein M8818_000057 [Zalaria obscura]|uniref:Uncharacterized protein n=1 Tax=Zalaria obscura TaxID=2024903 RepID=A0ACC3SP01_9PEZI